MQSIASLLDEYRTGTKNPQQVVEQANQLATESDPSIWIHRLSTDQLHRYVESLADLDIDNAPLWGVPFAIKDNIDLIDCPTTAGCPNYAYQPKDSAYVVDRIIKAGGIPIGKTNLDQFATGLTGTRSPYGIVKNAVDPEYIAGGSSSGSAVAVAADIVPFALGTDTAGSGRIPAALNGIIGFKPSKGWWSTRGVVPACRTLDCVSVFTQTVSDASIVANVAGCFDPLDVFSQTLLRRSFDIVKPIFGYFDTESIGKRTNTDYTRCYRRFVSNLPADAKVIDCEPFIAAGELLYEGPWVAERTVAVGRFLETSAESVHPVTRAVIEGGRSNLATECFECQYKLEALKREIEQVFQDVDILVLPTTTTHYTIAEVVDDPFVTNSNLGAFSHCMNLLDLCGVAVPAGLTDTGLPFGATLMAPKGSDAALLSAAALLSGEDLLGIAESDESELQIAVCGAHMTGMPLNSQLTERGAYFVEQTQTAPYYQLFALPDGLRPGLARVTGDGKAIELEIWSLAKHQLGGFLGFVSAPLAIGSIELADGRWVQGFVGDASVAEGAKDISNFGGWRSYVENL